MRALDAMVETVRRTARRAQSRSPNSTACPATRRMSRPRCSRGELITAVDAAEARSAAGRSIARSAIGPPTRSRWSRSPPSCSADGTGRVALGGVAHKPWRIEAAEAEMPRGAKAVAARLLAGAEADPGQRLQAAAGRAHARRRARRSEGLSHEIRHTRHDQSHRPAEGRRPSPSTASMAAEDDRARRHTPMSATMSCRTRPMATSSAPRSPRAASPRSISAPRRPRPACLRSSPPRTPASSARASSTPRPARRPGDRALSPGDRARGRGDLRAGARGRRN